MHNSYKTEVRKQLVKLLADLDQGRVLDSHWSKTISCPVGLRRGTITTDFQITSIDSEDSYRFDNTLDPYIYLEFEDSIMGHFSYI